MEDYYSGTMNKFDIGSVRILLDSVVANMAKNPNRKFTFPSVRYLEMWYKRALDSQKKDLQKLIKNNQFEVVNGGWVQED